MKDKIHKEFHDHPLTGMVIGCAIEVHRCLGPGLFESTYQQCLAHELNINKIDFRTQISMPVSYKGVKLDCGYRLDFLIEDFLVLELKSAENLNKVHQAQILTYMRLSEAPLGLLINFNVSLLKDGIRKLVLAF